LSRVANPQLRTFADVLDRLGGISPDRVRFDLKPGRATVRDLIHLHDREYKLYELVEGFLVEKIIGSTESYVAIELGRQVGNYLELNDIGFLLGADGTLRIMPHLVRIPGMSFVSWSKCPSRMIPHDPVPELCPDLAVEVLSRTETRREMARKLREYFESGVRLVWFIDPDARTAAVFTSPVEREVLTESQSLDGKDVLPGFKLHLKRLFARLANGHGQRRRRS
jgi:Uma2 family endonuclease